MNYIEQLKDAIDFHHGAIELYANSNTVSVLVKEYEVCKCEEKIDKNNLSLFNIPLYYNQSLKDNEVKMLLEENIKKWFDGVIEENKKYKIINLER
ncbi:hypothetical protein GCM10008908_24550 [Clostridium subterminale]|uniref:Uncharacterized protein n=1 Tax=Clostridium subterminale TaxID=1550 RepID=A0ABN1KS01_CLOSU